MPTRRVFLHSCGAVAAGFLLPAAPVAHRVHRCGGGGPLGPHPTPRVGITGAKVLTKEQLTHSPKLAPLFDSIRAIPGVIDGIRCNCGCAASPGFYSLLSCYEGDAMAQHCPICQGQGRLAARLHKEGKTLDEIRVAVDAQFGE
ncbi:MAG: hypothetical protein ABIZ70_04845 [Gemmatimonadales bacterium]